MHTCLCIQIGIHACRHMHMGKYVCIYIHKYTSHIYMYVSMYAGRDKCAYVCMYVHKYALQTHIYKCIHGIMYTGRNK